MKTSLSFPGGFLFRCVLLALVVIGSGFQSASAADSPLARLEKPVAALIQKYFPEAVVQRAATSFSAKHGTMEFVVHASDKTGRFHEKTNSEEGPNYRGFLLELELRDGPYEGAAAIPQEIRRPYWTTFVDAIPDAPANKHLFVHYSYGSQVNADFHRELRAMLK